MATLTKGMSYRRQGSSGLIWADQFTFTEDGALARGRQNDGSFMGANLGVNGSSDSNPGQSMMGRSNSVGGSFHGTATEARNHKTGFRVVRWLKKAFKIRF